MLPNIQDDLKTNGVLFQNWSKTFSSHCAGVYRPRTEEEVRKILVEANAKRKHIRVVGAGHSPSDLVCTSGYLLSLDNLNSVISLDQEKQTVTVQGGIRLNRLQSVLEKLGYSLPIVGSVTDISVAGTCATATHGSSLQHCIMSHYIESLHLMLADGSVVTCSRAQQPNVFAAAQVSLGALGVVISMTLKIVPMFFLEATETVVPLSTVFSQWSSNQFWEQGDFVRLQVFPFTNKGLVWSAKKIEPSKHLIKNYTFGKPKGLIHWFDKIMYQCMLLFGRIFKRALPLIERIWFYMHYGFRDGQVSFSRGPGIQQMQMYCWFSQYVNEWSIPISKAPEALERLVRWIQGDVEHAEIPFDARGVTAHWPIEVRVAAPTPLNECWLSTAPETTCYLEVIVYRPFGLSMPYERLWQAFEYLMNQYGGKPHWAKRHSLPPEELKARYPKLRQWLQLRSMLDPNNVFWNEYMQRSFGTNEE
ncbi:D-arabinono-1,4-lactone oxidase [Schizosaccharomyces japonicus yFS275]|uniref:D-arabinono-1,4-lactone oxidase n=1 Tax=Schizosaccharomyces japonicus (strain yFS275 / FY16936) TaxID=402676 RepID=B6JV62_SCHJY|nr:D-arabinono-1,4-lactone oxidase [Schizosaccharomyces japonicus yFS275]EEB05263.1 D-arabinono-1,4-lactone oxidase [Schizosaccharomyces japonicus yFS275]